MADPIRNISFVTLSVINQLKFYGIGMKHYAWLEEIAVRHYQTRLRGFEMPSIKSVKVNVDYATRIWPYPSDYIQYTKIAYSHNGKLYLLGVDNAIDLSETPPICDQPIEDNPNPTGGYYIWGWGGGQISTTPYASGGGFSANYYKDYPDKKYIQFSNALPPGYAVVEYLSMGNGVGGETLVLAAFEDALHKYLMWQVAELAAIPGLTQTAKDKERQYKDAIWDSKILSGPRLYEYQKELYRACGFALR